MYLNLCGRNVQCEQQQEFIYPCLPLSAPGCLLAQLSIPILVYDKREPNSITAGLHSLGLHSPVLGFAWRLLGLRTNNGSGLPPGHLLQLPCGWWRRDHLAIFYPRWQPLSFTLRMSSVQQKGILALLCIHHHCNPVKDHRQDIYCMFIVSAYQCKVKSGVWYSFVQCKLLLLCSGCSCLMWV